MAADLTLRALACGAVLACATCRGPIREWPAGELRSGGRSVVAALGPAEVHRYRLPLAKDQLLRLVVDQQGVDVVVALEDPADVRVLQADRLINDHGPELVLAVTERSGDYHLVVRRLEGSSPGRYVAHVEALRAASVADRRSAAAYRLFTGAEGRDEKKALELRLRALATWRELGEVALEAEALERIARQHFERQEYQPAADLYREAAAAFAHAGDRRWEAITRNGLGFSLLPLGMTQEAADQHTLALSRGRWTTP
jgi:tetratricopeptide (TPR) repeat protein